MLQISTARKLDVYHVNKAWRNIATANVDNFRMFRDLNSAVDLGKYSAGEKDRATLLSRSISIDQSSISNDNWLRGWDSPRIGSCFVIFGDRCLLKECALLQASLKRCQAAVMKPGLFRIGQREISQYCLLYILRSPLLVKGSKQEK
jgi:hypothetical protein